MSADGTTGYERLGSEPPVVYIPGLFIDRARCRAVAEELQDQFKGPTRRGCAARGAAGYSRRWTGHDLDDAPVALPPERRPHTRRAA